MFKDGGKCGIINANELQLKKGDRNEKNNINDDTDYFPRPFVCLWKYQ